MKKRKGLRAMTVEKRKEIAAKGGRAKAAKRKQRLCDERNRTIALTGWG